MAWLTPKTDWTAVDGVTDNDLKRIEGNILELYNTKLAHSLATAANDFLVASKAGTFVKKTLAEVKTILGLGSAAYTASTAYATAAQGTKADNALPKNPAIVAITGGRTLALSDEAKVLNCTNASAITITIPTNASVAFPTGTEIAIIRSGAGTVAIAPASGVTLNSKESKRNIDGQYASCALKKIATNTWVLVGALTT